MKNRECAYQHMFDRCYYTDSYFLSLLQGALKQFRRWAKHKGDGSLYESDQQRITFYDWRENLVSCISFEFFECDKVFICMNRLQAHWGLAVVFPDTYKIEVVDNKEDVPQRRFLHSNACAKAGIILRSQPSMGDHGCS